MEQDDEANKLHTDLYFHKNLAYTELSYETLVR